MANTEIKGIAFPFRIGGRGGIAMSGQTITHQQHIKESIMALLGTREYERVMRPPNGLEDLDVFFNDLNETTKNMAIFKIQELIQNYEPRVEVVDIQINEEELPDKSMAHIINVSYVEVDTGTQASLSTTI